MDFNSIYFVENMLTKIGRANAVDISLHRSSIKAPHALLLAVLKSLEQPISCFNILCPLKVFLSQTLRAADLAVVPASQAGTL